MKKITNSVAAKGIAVFLALCAVGGGTVYAGSVVTKNNLIDQEEAENFAIVDAGVDKKDVSNMHSHLERDNGKYVYDVEFYVGNVEYEYEVSAEDGSIIERDKEVKKNTASGSGSENKTGSASAANKSAEKAASSAGKTANNATDKTADKADSKADKDKTKAADPASGAEDPYIGVERAKEIALKNAERTEDEVLFSTAKLEKDDGRFEYDIEFYYGDMEYEYEIDAMTGEILEYSIERDDD